MLLARQKNGAEQDSAEGRYRCDLVSGRDKKSRDLGEELNTWAQKQRSASKFKLGPLGGDLFSAKVLKMSIVCFYL